MAPTIADMATITLTPKWWEGFYEALSRVGKAMRGIVDAIARNASTALQDLVRAVSVPTAPPARSYPGVDTQFRHRGRR